MKSRRPKQTLRFQNSSIYINDHLTKFNSDLSLKARQLVKQKEAYSTYICDGRVYIKWSQGSTPVQVVSLSDLC